MSTVGQEWGLLEGVAVIGAGRLVVPSQDSWRVFRGRSLRTEPSRKTCSPGLRERRRGQCRGPCGLCSTPPDLEEAPDAARLPKCSSVNNKKTPDVKKKSSHWSEFSRTLKSQARQYGVLPYPRPEPWKRLSLGRPCPCRRSHGTWSRWRPGRWRCPSCWDPLHSWCGRTHSPPGGGKQQLWRSGVVATVNATEVHTRLTRSLNKAIHKVKCLIVK